MTRNPLAEDSGYVPLEVTVERALEMVRLWTKDPSQLSASSSSRELTSLRVHILDSWLAWGATPALAELTAEQLADFCHWLGQQ